MPFLEYLSIKVLTCMGHFPTFNAILGIEIPLSIKVLTCMGHFPTFNAILGIEIPLSIPHFLGPYMYGSFPNEWYNLPFIQIRSKQLVGNITCL